MPLDSFLVLKRISLAAMNVVPAKRVSGTAVGVMRYRSDRYWLLHVAGASNRFGVEALS